MSSAKNEEKLSSSKPYLLRALYDWILDNGLTPYVMVDADIPGVRVPRQFVQDGRIVLNLSPTATSHFQMNFSKLQFRAGFGGTPFDVLLPIYAVQAIYAKENGQGMSFHPDMPGGDGGDDNAGSEIEFSEQAAAEENNAAEKTKTKPSHLKIVK